MLPKASLSIKRDLPVGCKLVSLRETERLPEGVEGEALPVRFRSTPSLTRRSLCSIAVLADPVRLRARRPGRAPDIGKPLYVCLGYLRHIAKSRGQRRTSIDGMSMLAHGWTLAV